MEIKKTSIGKYFIKSSFHIIKSKFIFFIISLYEILELTICLLNLESSYFHLDKNISNTKSNLIKIILKISPYSYYGNYQLNSNDKTYDRNYNIVIIYLLCFILFYIYIFFGTNETNYEKSKSELRKFIDKILINFFDFILFRLSTLYGFDAIFRSLFNITARKNLNVFNIIMSIILIIVLFVIIFTHIFYFLNVCLWHNFLIVNSYIHHYPFDSFFSKKYDIIIFLLKLFASLTQSYLDYKGGEYTIILVFLNFVINAIFYIYAIIVFYSIFFSPKALYVYTNFSNRLRIFFILLIFECLILHLALNSSNDGTPFFTYIVILIIFNIYLVTSKLDEYIYNIAVTSQNYLSVCWFLQTNDINKQDFTIEWISNHRTNCLLKTTQCPICGKLKSVEDIYSDEFLKKINEDKGGDFFLNFGKNKKIEVVDNEKKTMISFLFPPFTFFQSLIKLIEASNFIMSKNDLIRYDFIQLTALFQSDDKMIDFIIYTKIFYCINKYKNNSKVLMTFIMIYNLFGLSEKISKQKYEVLQKNEELRKSLNKYLKNYEEFILYKEKSPVNYYDISNKYKDFKDLLITIHVYFKNNIECNYELILMRYIYEILVNTKFSHTQPFDLNAYSEFLEYHFSSSRILLLKYNIQKEVFFILKGSKEMQKYQGKQFLKIFPRELRHEGASLLKHQLTNINKNESKNIFEFVIETKIKDIKFIDSFKMNFSIYPTSFINELFIQANYKIGYSNLLIFESYNQEEETLYSYSYQLFKIFLISPKDIQILKHSSTGILFYFKNLFKKRSLTVKNENGKEEKQKREYTFSFKDYLQFFKKIIRNDIMKESPNYFIMSEKIKQFETPAKEGKELVFQITKKFESKINLKTYNVYSIKEIRKKRIKKNVFDKGRPSEIFDIKENDDINKDEDEESDNEEEENNEFNSNGDVFEGKGMTMAGSLLSVSKPSSIADSQRAKSKKDEKNEEKKLKRQQLYKTVYIIVGFGIMLIGISIIFLILEDIENTKYQNLINLFYTFHIFKRGIESIPLTLISNYKYSLEGIQTGNLFQNYSEYLGAKYPLLRKNLINEVLLKDSNIKLTTIIQSFNNYLRELHSIEENLSKQITDLTGKSYKIEVQDDKIILYNMNINLISMGREYLNSLSILLNDNSFLNEYFILLSKESDNNNVITAKRSANGELSMTGKNMILVILTYPFLHDGLKTIAEFILEKSNNITVKITTVYLIFFSILLILHVILLVIGISFLFSFIKILKLSIEQGNKILKDKQYLEYLDKRLTQIKIMKNLYTEDPIKIMDKIESLDEIFKNKNKEDAKKNDVKIQKLGYDKNFNKDDETKNNDNHSINRKTLDSNNHNNNNTNNNNQFRVTIQDDIKLMTYDNNEKSKKDSIDKDEYQSIGISNINQKVPNKKLSFHEFYKINLVEFILLYFSFVLYFLYSIIMLIIIITGINKLYNLVDYMRYNDLLDAYIYDNLNTYFYIVDANSTSNIYGSLTDDSYKLDKTKDYIEDNIELLYDAAKNRDNIEQNKESYFVPFGKLTNFNCSKGIIQDDEMMEVLRLLNADYDQYFGELCKEFPVASTGVPLNLIYEIVYIVGKIYRSFQTTTSFKLILEKYLQERDLYDLLTLTLVFFRFQRNYFYNKVIMNEVNGIMDYFSTLILLYLVFCIIFEIIIFMIFYFGIIKQVKAKDKLFNNFIESFKYD